MMVTRRHPADAVGIARAADSAGADTRVAADDARAQRRAKEQPSVRRLVTRDGGAVVKGESLAALPPSVLAVLEADRDGGSYRPLESALLGEWEIPTDYAVSGSRTLDIPLQD